uniref:Uncharacterized protein n=1 Tax=Arundo donax TaxID=35708 RepID=A0A0A9A0A9_ARUDO
MYRQLKSLFFFPILLGYVSTVYPWCIGISWCIRYGYVCFLEYPCFRVMHTSVNRQTGATGQLL